MYAVAVHCTGCICCVVVCFPYLSFYFEQGHSCQCPVVSLLKQNRLHTVFDMCLDFIMVYLYSTCILNVCLCILNQVILNTGRCLVVSLVRPNRVMYLYFVMLHLYSICNVFGIRPSRPQVVSLLRRNRLHAP